jgi:hypothetical protein
MTNGNVLYGRAMLDSIAAAIPTFGRILIVKGSGDTALYQWPEIDQVFKSDDNGWTRTFTSLSDAYDYAQTNNNDVIVLTPYSQHTLSAGLATSKSRVHFFGLDGNCNRISQQSVKVGLTGTTATAYTLYDTGTRNSFRNIKFIQGSTAATALTVAQFGGEGTYVENCSFIFEVADNLGSTSANEVRIGADSCTFRHCSFGTDVLTTSAKRGVMSLTAAIGSGDGAKSNKFEDCQFLISSSDATALFVQLASAGGAKFINTFKNCDFLANVMTTGTIVTLNVAVETHASFNDGLLFFIKPNTNATKFAVSTLNKGIRINGPVFSANAMMMSLPTT